jgi:hypothetical protein
MQRSDPYQRPISGESALQETGDDFNRSSAARRSSEHLFWVLVYCPKTPNRRLRGRLSKGSIDSSPVKPSQSQFDGALALWEQSSTTGTKHLQPVSEDGYSVANGLSVQTTHNWDTSSPSRFCVNNKHFLSATYDKLDRSLKGLLRTSNL